MDEIARRRIKPVSYNLEHGIAPQVVKKEIPDLIDGDYEKEALGVSLEEEHAKAKIQQMSEKQLAKEITCLEKKMIAFAKNLEF